MLYVVLLRQRPRFQPQLFQMKSGEIDEVQIATIVKDCLKCLAYLHGEKIIHRDVKGSHHQN